MNEVRLRTKGEPFKKIILDETDVERTVNIRWNDGYFESFGVRQIRISETLLFIRLWDGGNRYIPLRNVRWYALYPEDHEKEYV